MIKVSHLHEAHSEVEIDSLIEHYGNNFSDGRLLKVFDVKRVDDQAYGLIDQDGDIAWWFGPRHRIDPWRWFCCLTEDNVWHKFDVSTVDKCVKVMEQFKKYIETGKMTDSLSIELLENTEFMDI